MSGTQSSRPSTLVRRTEAQADAERKAIAKYVMDLKADTRTKWEIITDDPDHILILRAPLDGDLSGYAEYGWAGPFRYLEESYSEAGPFSARPEIKTVPYREYGLVRSENVLSQKELKTLASRESDRMDRLKNMSIKSWSKCRKDIKKSGTLYEERQLKDSIDDLIASFEDVKKSGHR